MAERHVLDSQQLKEALAAALAVHCEPVGGATTLAGATHAIIRVNGVPGVEFVIDPDEVQTLADKLADVTASSLPADPEAFAEVLADVASVTGNLRLRIGKARAADPSVKAAAREILTDFAINSVALLARSLRHYMPRRGISVTDVGRALQRDDRSMLVAVFRRSLGIGADKSLGANEPIARAFIATPLTHLKDDEHENVMALATQVRILVNQLGMVAICPEPSLRPTTTTAYDPDEISRDEQLLIAGADVLVGVGCEFESWGVSRSVSWAEAGCSIVVLTSLTPSFYVSRVLSSNPNRTFRVDQDDDPAEMMKRLNAKLRGSMPIITRHAVDRIRVSQQARDFIGVARRKLDTLDRAAFDEAGITLERAAQMLSSPVMMSGASMMETRILRSLLGEQLDPLLDVLSGRSGAESRDHGPAGGRVVSLRSFANLESVAEIDGWTADELVRLIRFHLDPAIPGEHRHSPAPLSGNEWRALYKRVFGR